MPKTKKISKKTIMEFIPCTAANPEDKEDARTHKNSKKTSQKLTPEDISDPTLQETETNSASNLTITQELLQNFNLKRKPENTSQSSNAQKSNDNPFTRVVCELNEKLAIRKNKATNINGSQGQPENSRETQKQPSIRATGSSNSDAETVSSTLSEYAEPTKKVKWEKKEANQLALNNSGQVTNAYKIEKEEANNINGAQGELVITYNDSSNSENEKLYQKIQPLITELKCLLDELKPHVSQVNLSVSRYKNVLAPEFMSNLEFEIDEKYSSEKGLNTQDFKDLESSVVDLRGLLRRMRPLSIIQEESESRAVSMIASNRNSMQRISETTEPNRKSTQRNSVLDMLDKLIEELESFNLNASSFGFTQLFKPSQPNSAGTDNSQEAASENQFVKLRN